MCDLDIYTQNTYVGIGCLDIETVKQLKNYFL